MFSLTASRSDSFNPASREWTELYLCNREKESEWLTVGPDEISSSIEVDQVDPHSPLILRIESEKMSLAARAAFYLATFTAGQVAVNSEEVFSPPNVLLPLLGDDFDPKAALARAAASPFARSTLDHPYPNLDK